MLQTRRLLFMVAALSMAGLCGCGSGKKGVELQAKLLLPGNIRLGEQASSTITFVPEDSKSESASGKYKTKDQPFPIDTSQGKGILPGKYKVTVQLNPYPGSEEAKTQANAVKSVNGRYNLEKTPLSYEVTNDSKQAITIDLNKGTIQKN